MPPPAALPRAPEPSAPEPSAREPHARGLHAREPNAREPNARGLHDPELCELPLRFELACQPPYDWEWVLSFLSRRLIGGVERIDRDAYSRVVRLPHAGGWAIGRVAVQSGPGRAALTVALAPALADVQGEVLAGVRRLFDLDREPGPVNAVLGELAADAPGVRVPGAFDGFELAVRAILGQQVTVKAAHTLAGRLAARFGDGLPAQPNDGPNDGPNDAPGSVAGEPPAGARPLSRAFPDAARMAGVPLAELTACGLIRSRAAAIQAIAQAIVDDGLVLAPGAPLERTLAQLKSLRGIGDWTAQYVAMRALAWPDAFPASDLILMRALGARTPAQAAAAAQAWRPWRSYAVMHLWRRGSWPRTAAGEDRPRP